MARLSLLQVFLIWVAGFGTLSLALRRRVADLVDGLRLPRIIKYLAIATPIILMEEALTIEVPYFWGILPMLVVFQIMFLPLYFIQRVTRCSFVLASLLFGAWGCFNEFILAGRIHQMSGAILLLMVSLCFLIYSVMAILPSYYLGAALKGDMRPRRGGPICGER
jgi:hypothetical protein